MVICPFCGFEFEVDDSLCHHGCPLSSACNLTRCPSCDYEFPQKPRTLTRLRRLLFGRRGEAAVPGPEACRSVRDLKSGEVARVRCLSGRNPSRNNSLAVFGLVPGSEVLLVQRHPEYVLRVGETDLALDAAIAGEILVEPLDATA